MRHSRPLPPGDKRVLFFLIVHLCFLPWALGTMHAWSQAVSLALAALGFAVALSARGGKYETGDLRPEGSDPAGRISTAPFQVSGFKSQVSRLYRFVPFWLGLALLVYIAAQAFNPSWRYTTNGSVWWLVPVPNISWLPTSVDTPFERFNLWRQFIIYASAWLTLCTAWIGLTRRRSLTALFMALAINALVLTLVGFIYRLNQAPDQLLWLGRKVGSITFASFIYKNHAGAYLAIIAAVYVLLAVRRYERAVKEHAHSSPTLLYVLGAIALLFAVIFTYSRGATGILGAYLLGAGILFGIWRFFSQTSSSTPRIVTFTIAGMVAFVVIFAVAQLDFRRVVDHFEKLSNPERMDVSLSQRLEANTAGLDMLSNTWPRGIGAGGFRYVFPQYIRRFEGSYKGGKLFWEHAHNDWLQLPIELGVGGIILIVAGGIWWLVAVLRGRVWRRLPALLLALGLFQTLAHASFDFPFQNPAILITWLVLAVLAIRYAALDEATSGRR